MKKYTRISAVVLALAVLLAVPVVAANMWTDSITNSAGDGIEVSSNQTYGKSKATYSSASSTMAVLSLYSGSTRVSYSTGTGTTTATTARSVSHDKAKGSSSYAIGGVTYTGASLTLSW